MEPERPIEKLLRAWANKRRRDAEPPLDLHPATRRLLQGEVARKFGANQRQARTFSSWFAAVWPRFALALGVFAVLGTVVWLSVPPFGNRNQRGWLAKGEAPAAPELADKTTTRSAGQSGRPTEMFDRAGSRSEPIAETAKKEFAEGQSRSQPAPALEPQVGNRTDTIKRVPLDSLATETRKAERLANSPVPSASPGARGEASAAGANVTTAPKVAADSAPSPGLSARVAQPAARQYGATGPATTTQPSANSLSAIPPGSSTLAGGDLSLAKDGVMKQSSDEAERSGAANKPLAAAAPSPAVSPSQAYFYADGGKVQKLTNGERFARVELQTKAKALMTDKNTPVKAVLASFQVERIGSEVRVVDADGSVYTGYVQSPGENASARPVMEEKNSAGGAGASRSRGVTVMRDALADAEAQVDYTFRVAGTNRTLNENVVFIGQLTAGTNVNSPAAVTNSLEIAGYARKVAPAAATATGNAAAKASRISGKAEVGKRGEVEINAVSAGK